MPMHFPSKRQEAAKRRRQYILSIVVLLLALAVLVGWLVFRFYVSGALNNKPETNDTPPAPVEEVLADTASTLLILGENGNERFVLLQFNPAQKQAYALSIPANLNGGGGQSLISILQKNGAPHAKETVSQVLGLPIAHYISLSTDNVESYLNYLESGVPFSLSESVRYTDPNGVVSTIPAGDQALTASQVAVLLRHTGWSDPALSHRVAAQLVTAVVNRFMQPNHSYDGDFAALSNRMLSDIRIDHYNAYKATLLHLSGSNTGSLCQVLSLPGNAQNGLFQPDTDALKNTPLYNE